MKVVTFTNVKGGVGKTTCSDLTALYIIMMRRTPVVVIDLDPQCGSSVLFLKGKDHERSIKTALDMVLEGEDPSEIMTNPYPVEGRENLFIIPSHSRLTETANHCPVNLLRLILESTEYGDDVTVIIDTGTGDNLVAMGLAAADGVVVPMMLSKQCARPTTKTLNWISAHQKTLLGILPVASAQAKWENVILEKMTELLETHKGFKAMGASLLPRIPYSRSVVRGEWVTGTFPEIIIPSIDAVYTKIFGESAIVQEEPLAISKEESANVA